jgi:hypothetical protein
MTQGKIREKNEDKKRGIYPPLHLNLHFLIYLYHYCIFHLPKQVGIPPATVNDHAAQWRHGLRLDNALWGTNMREKCP